MKTAAIATAASAAVMMSVCLFSNSWYTFEKDFGEEDWYDEPMVFSSHVGLTEVETCRNDECETNDFPSLSEADEGEAFIVFGWVTTVVGALAVVLLVVLVLLAATRNAGARGSGFAALAVCALAAVSAIAFLTSAPDEMKDEVSVGWAAIVFVMSCGAGIVSGAMAVRGAWGWATALAVPEAHVHARAPVAGPPPGAQRPVPPCPQCRAPTQWVEQYQRHYCGHCRVYL